MHKLCVHVGFQFSWYSPRRNLGHKITLSLTFWSTNRLFANVSAPAYIPTSSGLRAQISLRSHQHSLLSVAILQVWSENWLWFGFVKHLSCLLAIYLSFGEMPNQISCSFINYIVFLLLNYGSFLRHLDTTPRADIWFANISSRSVNDLFTFLLVSFDPTTF